MSMLLQRDRVLMCALSLRGRELRGLHPSAVSPYNGSLFKPWYLSGQVEVYCLMSSMWPESGTYAADRGLCPVSDWGLGLVTGPQFYPSCCLAAYTPTHLLVLLPLAEVRG